MKLQIALLGGLLCLGAAAPAQTSSQSKSTASTQSANRVKRPVSTDKQSFTGCVDEQDGKYVLLDEQLRRFVSLQAPTSDPDAWFAKHVGHKVQVSGSQPAGEANSVKVDKISRISGMCGGGE